MCCQLGVKTDGVSSRFTFALHSPFCPMKTGSTPSFRKATLSVSLVLSFSTLSAVFATDFQWRGTTDSLWTTTTNWGGTGVAITGASGSHRLNINSNTTFNEAVYTADQGNTTYANTAGRGLVIGSGTLLNGTLRITGGKFSTVGSTANDIIGNTTPNSANLIIDGGEYETGRQLDFGLGSGTTGTLTINSGTATVTEIGTNNTTATFNLNGGTLAMNRLVYAGFGTNRFNLNGGTLKARISTTAFIPTPGSGSTTLSVLTGGAVIDTNTFDITIARPLLEDATAFGGGLTKNGTGLLTLGAVSTTSGPAVVNAGGLGVRAGITSWSPSSFTHSGDVLNFNVGVFDFGNVACIDTLGALTLNSTITVNVLGSQFVVGQIPLIKYVSKTGAGSLVLNPATLPPGVVATLKDDGAGLIYLDVTQGGFIWSGDSLTLGTGDWDATSFNWNGNTSTYANPAPVTFPTIFGGGTITLNSSFSPASADFTNTVGNDYILTGTGKITGAALVNKTGNGRVTFNGTNDYSGNTNITSGILSIASTAALPGWNVNSRYPISSGATLAVQNAITDAEIATLLATTGNFNSGAFLGFDVAAGDRTFTGNLAGALGVASVGSNILTLSGTNTHTGTTLVGANAVIHVGSLTAFTGTGPLTVNSGGTFDLKGFNANFTNLNAANGTITTTGTTPGTDTLTASTLTTNGTGALYTDGPNRTLALNITSSGTAVLTATTNAANTYSGGLVLGNAMRLTVLTGTTGFPGAIESGPYGKGPITINGGTTDATGTQIWFNAGNRTLMNDVIVNGNFGNGARAGSFRIGTNAAALSGIEVSGNITANLTDATFGADSTSDGTLFTLSGKLTGPRGFRFFQSANAFRWTTVLRNATTSPNDYLGSTTISNTQTTLALGAAEQIPHGLGKGDVAVTFGTLDLAGFDETINGLSGGTTALVDNVTSGADNTLTIGEGDATGANFSGVISNSNNTLSLTKTGSGTQTLSGLNTYTGPTAINGGTLALGAAGSIAASSALSIAPNAVLDTLLQPTYLIPTGQPLTFRLDGSATGSSGQLKAAGLDITNATVAFTMSGPLDDPAYVLATYSTLTGAAFATVTAPSGYVLDYAYNGGTQIALVQSGASDYDTWMMAFPSLTGAEKLPTADPDNDGLTNRQEYAFGLVPNNGASVNPIPVVPDKTSGQFTYTRRKPSLTGLTTWKIMTSPDLLSWTQDATATQSATAVPATDNENVVVTLTGAPLTAPRLFVRVIAE